MVTELDLAPASASITRIVAWGMAIWAVALVACLVIPALREGPRGYWPWTALCGCALGALGTAYLRRGRGNARDATR